MLIVCVLYNKIIYIYIKNNHAKEREILIIVFLSWDLFTIYNVIVNIDELRCMSYWNHRK